MSINLACIVVGCLLALYLAQDFLYPKTKPLPPGPQPLPLIGNIHQHQSASPWGKHQEWHRKYGPIITLKLGSRTVIMLGSQKVVRDFARMGYLYSSRPRLILVGEWMFSGMLPALMPNGAQWDASHKLIAPLFAGHAVKTYNEAEALESARMVYELLGTQWHPTYFRTYTSSIAKLLGYGQRDGPDQADEAAQVEALIYEAFGAVSIDKVLVDLYPCLDHLPAVFAKFKMTARRHQKRVLDLWSLRAKRAIQRSDVWSWTQVVHKNMPEAVMSWEHFIFLLFELESAATITTAQFLNIFVTIALEHPHSIQRAQSEMDAVVGHDKLPSFTDQDQLPYLNAFILEIARHRTMVPVGFPHAAMEEGEYMGYRIPTDALIMSNQWLLNMDESTYDNPEVFRPDRWIENPSLPLPSLFGFGRRKCPGERMAKDSIFIAIARLLWAFDIKQTAQEKRASSTDTHNLLYIPQIENVTFEVRSAKHRAVVERQWRELDKDERHLMERISRYM
ncbi:cytochrome P450 [Aspergillus pseudotamarii]|uniref:Cytochrome P450 n=1 Tax=Aspergillus pseudotamarii TaxID=132259 RepID=A0A5N6SL05_ASPPS|nr:cytochrome P450 [Aspergillus pseudotamarii]KAE8134440.1 cytochrome P450 [Aspergillus pseudotamarii]